MASWGDVNAALNRLVREGVIAGFKTNRGDKARDAGLHVTITPAGDEDVEALRGRIVGVLAPMDDEVTVTVADVAASQA